MIKKILCVLMVVSAVFSGMKTDTMKVTGLTPGKLVKVGSNKELKDTSVIRVDSCNVADTALHVPVLSFIDSARAAHKADTSINAKRSDTTYKAGWAKFADSSRASHLADSAKKAGRASIADSSVNAKRSDTTYKAGLADSAKKAPGSISGLTTGYIPKAASATSLSNSLLFSNDSSINIKMSLTPKRYFYFLDTVNNMHVGLAYPIGSGKAIGFDFNGVAKFIIDSSGAVDLNGTFTSNKIYVDDTFYTPAIRSNPVGGRVTVNDTTSYSKFLAIGNTFGATYIYGNTINFLYSYNSETNAVGYLNYNGYLNGATLFRDISICDGKNSNVLFVDGSAASIGIGTTGPTSTLHNNGSFSLPIRTVTATTTITSIDYTVIGETNPLRFDLPQASTCSGRMYCLIAKTSDVIDTINPYASDSVFLPGGNAYHPFPFAMSYDVQSDGGHLWYVKANTW